MGLDVATLINEYQIFIGIIMVPIIGGFLYSLRSIPKLIWKLFVSQFTVEITVKNDELLYDNLRAFLDSLDFVKNRCRRLTVSTQRFAEGITLTPSASGFHWFKYKGKFILFHRTITDEKARHETIILRYLGRKRLLLKDILTEISADKNQHPNEIKLYKPSGSYWQSVGYRSKRSLDSVVVANNLDKDLLADIELFYNNKEWYIDRGLPYHRGYLLSGPPGTGKTSLIVAIASTLGKDIALVDINSVGGDSEFLNLITNLPPNTILVMEDIDAAMGTRKRKEVREDTQSDIEVGMSGSAHEEREQFFGVTLSGVLNGLDGIMTPDNQVYVMTTNHPKKLDPALLRPGRIDNHQILGLMDRELAGRLAKKLRKGESKYVSYIQDLIDKEGPKSPAEVQNILLSWGNDDG